MSKERKRTSGASGASARKAAHGETSVEQDKGRAPKLPHERDESASHMASPPRKSMKRAHDDVVRGARDTDRGPVADATYQKLKKVAASPAASY
jgi:hypothetical protein